MFFNKIECLQYASKIKNYKVSYHLFDSAYEALDWTAEPKSSLDELYKLRAWQIRDKYKYVVLAFSGGADSSNVLDTFIENNIPLDEIVTYYPIKAIEKFTGARAVKKPDRTTMLQWVRPNINWWRIPGSNWSPTACKAAALPNELIPQNLVHRDGIEPPTATV